MKNLNKSLLLVDSVVNEHGAMKQLAYPRSPADNAPQAGNASEQINMI
ncbi:MAG: hypothetical protein ABSF46_29425 [Terriglobia bacterium]|jgi:hypothetical protein